MTVEANQGKPTTVRCGIYARCAVMLHDEAAVGKQIAECRRVARETGWLVASGCIRSDAGTSRTSIAGRPGLQALRAVAETKARPFDVLCCESISRMSRNLSDVLAIEDTLRRNGIQLSFVADEIRSSILDAEPVHGRLAHWIQFLRGARAGWHDGLAFE